MKTLFVAIVVLLCSAVYAGDFNIGPGSRELSEPIRLGDWGAKELVLAASRVPNHRIPSQVAPWQSQFTPLYLTVDPPVAPTGRVPVDYDSKY